MVLVCYEIVNFFIKHSTTYCRKCTLGIWVGSDLLFGIWQWVFQEIKKELTKYEEGKDPWTHTWGWTLYEEGKNPET